MDIFRNKTSEKRLEKEEEFIQEGTMPFRDENMPETNFSDRYSRKTLLSWQAPDFEVYEKDNKWYAYVFLILIAIIGYAVYSNSLIMAIAFILIGVIIYIQINREPKIVNFSITADGVIADKEIFEFNRIQSFWIFYDPPHEKYVSLHTRGHLIPFIHIALADQDPLELRAILIKYIPEVKQEPGMVDVLERLLRI